MSSTIHPCGQWTSSAHSHDICVGCKGLSCKCCGGTKQHIDPSTLQNARKRINYAFAENKGKSLKPVPR